MNRPIPNHEQEVIKAQANAMLARILNGRGAAPVMNGSSPVRPTPAKELVKC